MKTILKIALGIGIGLLIYEAINIGIGYAIMSSINM